MITLQNNTRTTFIHGDYRLEANGIIPVPDDVAKIWMQNQDVIEYVAPADAKAEKAAYEAEIEKLKKEIEELKAGKMADAKAEKIKK